MSKQVLIVDGFSTGAWLADHLSANGVRLHHVTSRDDFPELYWEGFDTRIYDELRSADEARIAIASSQVEVDWVVPGNESGVAFADEIAELLQVRGNRTSTTHQRTDKQAMADALVAHHVRGPRSAAFTDVVAARSWLVREGLEDCVVKPRVSSASDGLEDAFRNIHENATILGVRNHDVVVSEKLTGPELYVNTVSYDGIVTYHEAWRSVKSVTSDGIPQYDYSEPLDPDHELARASLEYLADALPALGLVWGGGHTEIICTGRGPVAIDPGSRLGGAATPSAEEKLLGDSQAHAYARMLLEDRAPSRRYARQASAVRRVWLNNQFDGLVADDECLKFLDGLPTMYQPAYHLAPDTQLSRTTNLVNSPGHVLLASDDVIAVERDHAQIRQWESAPFYGRPS
jgi:hypothetical protein